MMYQSMIHSSNNGDVSELLALILLAPCHRPEHLSSAQTARRADSPCAVEQITSTFPAIPPALRGAYRDRHGTLRRGVVAAGRRSTSMGCGRTSSCGRSSRVVPTPRRWCLGRRHPDDGGKQARSPGRARSSRSNHRAGKAGLFPAEPVVPSPCLSFARGPRVPVGTRPSLRPLH